MSLGAVLAWSPATLSYDPFFSGLMDLPRLRENLPVDHRHVDTLRLPTTPQPSINKDIIPYRISELKDLKVLSCDLLHFARLTHRIRPLRNQGKCSEGTQCIKQNAQFIAVCRRSKMVAMGTRRPRRARVFAGDEPWHGEERRSASARFDALQSVIN